MNCNDARQKLTHIITDQVSIDTDAQLLEHLKSCELCQTSYTDLQLGHVLQQISVPSLPPGFVEQSIARAIEQHQTRRSLYPVVDRVAVAVLVFAISIGVGVIVQHNDGQLDSRTTYHATPMAANQTNDIHVVIESDSFHADTSITVSLAGNLQLAGYEHAQKLNWQTDLKPGKNVITLPLITQGSEGGHVDVAYHTGEDSGGVRVVVSEV